MEKSDKSKKHSKVAVPVPEEPVAGKDHHRKTLSEKITAIDKSKRTSLALLVVFVVFTVVTVLASVSTIAVSIIAAIVTKGFDRDQSGRLVGLVLLAVTASVTISASTYATAAAFTKKKKPIHTAAIVLVIIAVIQAIITGASVKVTATDQNEIAKSLADSFKSAKDHNPKNLKQWSSTQNSLRCCGYFGPEDYRPYKLPRYFPPDVPVSCCPEYDPNRSEMVQEREREACKSRKEFYDTGCKDSVVEVFTDASTVAVHVVIVLIVLEVLTSISAAVLYVNRKRKSKQDNNADHHEAK